MTIKSEPLKYFFREVVNIEVFIFFFNKSNYNFVNEVKDFFQARLKCI